MPDTRIPSAFVFASPAAMPATCVPWSSTSLTPTNGSVSSDPVAPGREKTRATITFGVVYAVFPFGNSGGYEKPAGAKKGCVWSMPWSMMPIFMPFPAVCRSGPQSCVAPMSFGVRSSVGRYVTLGHTRRTPGTRPSRATSDRGTTTAIPLRTTE